MEITELKKKIEDNDLGDNFFVFQLQDESSSYISNQYINQIAENLNLEKKFIDDVKDIPTDTGFIEDTNLYIIKTDSVPTDVTPSKNCIYVCNKTKYKEAVKFPKLEQWQFVEYINSKAPGIGKTDLEWLITKYETTNSRVKTTNYFRLENDIDKIAIFDEEDQAKVFDELYSSGEYDTVSNLTIFDLSNGLLRKDIATCYEVLKVFDYIDSKPHVWLLSILLNSIRKVIFIQEGKNVTAESLGISDKQFYVIKKLNIGYYSLDKLIRIYETLTDIENKYKFGGLTQEQLADYIVCKILAE